MQCYRVCGVLRQSGCVKKKNLSTIEDIFRRVAKHRAAKERAAAEYDRLVARLRSENLRRRQAQAH